MQDIIMKESIKYVIYSHIFPLCSINVEFPYIYRLRGRIVYLETFKKGSQIVFSYDQKVAPHYVSDTYYFA